LNTTLTSSDVINSTSTSLLDVKKTAAAALITAQALQNQLNTTSTNGTIFDGHNNIPS
jgi:hypothetical protein